MILLHVFHEAALDFLKIPQFTHQQKKKRLQRFSLVLTIINTLKNIYAVFLVVPRVPYRVQTYAGYIN